MPVVNLTDRFVAGAKCPADKPQEDYFDEKNRGLALRVTKAGVKSWNFIYTAPATGKRARWTFARYPEKGLAAARTQAFEASGLVKDGRDPQRAFADDRQAGHTFESLAASYLALYARPNLRSADELEQRLKRSVLPVIGHVRLADLHARDINRALDPILEREAPIEANRTFQAIRAILRWAVRRGDLERSPTEGMEKPAPEADARKRVLSDPEIRQFLKALPVALAKSKTAQRILRIALLTGQRVGEIAGMRRDELNLKTALWSLPADRTKNGAPHTVPLSAPALAVIKEAMEAAGKESRFLFPAGDASLDPHVIATTLRRAHQATGERSLGRFDMAPFTAHDLRRTCLTGLAELGVAPIVIGAVANHLSVTKASVTFAHYVNYDYGAEKRAALDLWAKRVTALGRGAK